MAYTEDQLAEIIYNTLKDVLDDVGYTGTFNAIVGNGNSQQPKVAVPNRAGYFYVHTFTDGNIEVFEALDVNGLLSLNNKSGGKRVKVGYLPGDSRERGSNLVIYSIDSVAPASDIYTGIAPSQLELLNQKYITPDRFYFMRLVAAGGFIINFIGGFARYGNENKVLRGGEVGDLFSYLPTIGGQARFVACYWNVASENPVLVAGNIFVDDVSADRYAQIPTSIPDDCVRLGFVFLKQGITAITDANIIYAPDLFYVPSETIAVNVLTDENDVELTDEDDVLLEE